MIICIGNTLSGNDTFEYVRCLHCVSFAPLWIELVTTLRAWSSTDWTSFMTPAVTACVPAITTLTPTYWKCYQADKIKLMLHYDIAARFTRVLIIKVSFWNASVFHVLVTYASKTEYLFSTFLTFLLRAPKTPANYVGHYLRGWIHKILPSRDSCLVRFLSYWLYFFRNFRPCHQHTDQRCSKFSNPFEQESLTLHP